MADENVDKDKQTAYKRVLTLITHLYAVLVSIPVESENSEISIVNSADERSIVPYIRVNNCTLKIGGKVNVAKMILFYTACKVDLTNADFNKTATDRCSFVTFKDNVFTSF